ncbi:glycosyltransferase [Streptomyces sp. NPDC091289]|uniref:glycosyltransferase n=1 Tax=Streptomyces sp. NPDC091289 TaxID=3365989 RepID=UPI0037F487D7
MHTTDPVRPSDLRDVTVVVRLRRQPADALDACFGSLQAQSIGQDRMEVVPVGDEPSLVNRLTGRARGGRRPSPVREWSVSRAAGRYVIFLDGSDRLAVDALERLVSAADADEADVVVGAAEGPSPDPAPARLFRESQAHADLWSSRLYWSLTADKLFRTELLRRRALDFPYTGSTGDEMAFTASALVAADSISVVAGPPCLVNGARPVVDVPVADRPALADRLMRHAESLAPEGARRDHLLSRHLERELADATGAVLSAPLSDDERERVSQEARKVLDSHLTDGALALLPRPLAVQFALLSAGRFAEARTMAAYRADKEKAAPRKTVENGRVFTTLPFFRDPGPALPDDLFDITDRMTVTQELGSVGWNGSILLLEGHAFFEQLSTRDRATKVVLRERGSGAEERFSVTARRDEELFNAKGKPRAMGRFSSRVNFRQTSSGWPVPPGIWDLYLSVSFEGVTQEVRLGHRRSEKVDVTGRAPVRIAPSPRSAEHELFATLFWTEDGDLSVDVSERVPPAAGH